ncbi:AlwI family type II restriction endonuclease [Alkalihalobacterium elongatum]|uniref:AlwI family type II restriction endonuclease n=1 Tax=Alkalihalobacterium elongatum TaxID=2675466 RepID=UPI001C1FFC88|nr:AlwI family type II restriction endonuclease [Alkalihalobacterium elongatum]
MSEKAWYIGNTTIRNAKRLKDGLRVLVNSSLHGNLSGKNNEQAFAKLLHDKGVVFVKRLEETPEKDASDVGRKWRAALMQLGFIRHPESDKPFTVTPNGIRLINVNTLPAEQEVFLRALLAHQIPSVIEDFPEPVFSPLRIVLEILNRLEAQNSEAKITKDEMAFIVQVTRKIDDVNNAVEKIKQFRTKLTQFDRVREKRQYINECREEVASYLTSQSSQTLKDYADSNFRYLKLTGLFVENGSSLKIALHKQTIYKQIITEPYMQIPSEEYLHILWNGAMLPTDNASKAVEAINSTVALLESNGEAISLPNLTFLNEQDLSHLRLNLEEDWLRVLEKRYASNQINEWEDILEYLKALTRPIRKGSKIPQGEGPAYFEWALWRAFLAINHLENLPWEARRFRVDEEFYPLGHAVGGGSDLIFEFEDFVIVGEVTLSSSSRQEAMEGAPVRKHVADMVNHYAKKGKRVYGLFMANTIDTNTAETFRLGVWYQSDDTRLDLEILPITLEQFTLIFENGFRGGNSRLTNRMIENLIKNCRQNCSSLDAPSWKLMIEKEVNQFANDIKITS